MFAEVLLRSAGFLPCLPELPRVKDCDLRSCKISHFRCPLVIDMPHCPLELKSICYVGPLPVIKGPTFTSLFEPYLYKAPAPRDLTYKFE